jgi:Glycosyl hydrolases family 2, sugar binding domain/Glycosyl hydrolases family 2/Glycosyl hydrolases family 2, TIM barrel domain
MMRAFPTVSSLGLGLGGLLLLHAASGLVGAQETKSPSPTIPLPEHPRPDFERAAWVNLNGTWQFRFDKADEGLVQNWQKAEVAFPLAITVPFPWGSALSGLRDEAPIGWYARTIEIPSGWEKRRVFLVVGAADWHTTAWLDGQKLGEHKGGYTPFEFELTHFARPGTKQRLTLRVDDVDRPFKLEGKQGYGNARGIWQTPYLEARGASALATLHFTPDIDAKKAAVDATLLDAATRDLTLRLAFKTGGVAAVERRIPKGETRVKFDVAIPDPRLWSLEDPFLYEVEARLGAGTEPGEDVVSTYFGMRKISVVNLPGTDHPYVALNGEPVYLQLALDQAYHPDGFYTFPSDEFVRNEVLRARQIGLNGLREHVKVELPRKLYWADRLGVLIMADVPNSWGEPTAEMQQEVEQTMRRMIRRDYNHPSIFSWIPFNETWGLFTNLPKEPGEKEAKKVYKPETQKWVASVYRLAKSLDATRLVEDNSVCCERGHTETDINSWHAYLPGWAWDEELDKVTKGTHPGSTWNFESGYQQDRQPNINSEFGNVWGYEGSTGDVDWSWDYHRAVNSFRRHPKVAGWLYTEHHDVINEWNGYWRFDRSEKDTGLGDLAEGMTLRDLHAPLYVAVGTPADLSRAVKAGETEEVPLWASFLTGRRVGGDALVLQWRLHSWDTLGRKQTGPVARRNVTYRPWMSEALPPLSVVMPKEPGVAVLAVELTDRAGIVLHRNLTTFVVEGTRPDDVTLADGRRAHVARIDPARFSSATWSLKQWNVLDGLKVNGAGSGHFEYRVPWPSGLKLADVATAAFLVEASAKKLHGKDRDDAAEMAGDYMRGLGTLDPSRNPNAYPMTDGVRFPSAVMVRVNGVAAGRHELPDDPADHRGILSWHAQLKDKKLREAGSYGYLLKVEVPRAALEKAAASGTLEIRLEVDPALPGGLALYGARFGRYPVDPTVLFIKNQ